MVGVLLPRPAEDPAGRRFSWPPRWCTACEAGCSIERCWLCGGETVEIAESRRGMRGNPGTWRPDE